MINLWLFGRIFMYSTDDAEIALKWARFFAFLGVVHIAPATYLFSVHWLKLYEKQKKFLHVAFFLSPVFYLLTALTPYGIASVKKQFWGFYPVYGLVCKLFLVYFLFYFLFAFYNFYLEFKKTQDANKKKQVQLIGAAFVIAFIGSTDYLPKFTNWEGYPFGYICVFVWIAVIGYAIVKYRTLDIQTVVHKTIMWLLASSVLGAPMVAFFYTQKDLVYNLPAPIYMAVLIVSFVVVVLYTRHVQPHIDHLFQRRQWDLARVMERFTDELVHLRGLRDVEKHILMTVRNLFYASNVSLIVRNEELKCFQFAEKETSSWGDANFSIEEAYLKWLEKYDQIVFQEYLSLDPRTQVIADQGKEYFKKTQSLICVPMVVNEKLLGVLSLGEKQSLRKFTPAEIAFLNDFRKNAGIALANALYLVAMQENLKRWNEELEKKVEERTEQLKDTQAQLVQAEKLATIGTLAGGVAHEINNPLTAVLTNAQILKMDANPEDVESLELIEEGAKRCQTIIQNLLKYARKSDTETRLAEVDIHKMITNVTSLLAYQIKQDDIELILDLEEITSIEGVSNELEQVITNLIVNARDALKLKGDQGRKIWIATRMKGNQVEISVRDNGSGMLEEVKKKIFDPFYTTKDVGGGTGLGLAVSYGIIQKHKGAVEVQSELNVGTTFIMLFPSLVKS